MRADRGPVEKQLLPHPFCLFQPTEGDRGQKKMLVEVVQL